MLAAHDNVSIITLDALPYAGNLGGNCELANIDVVGAILDVLGKPHSLITFMEDRPGRDRRYAMDTTKIRHAPGWNPAVTFEDGITRTIWWYQANTE